MSLLVIGTVAFDSIKTPFGSVERVIGGAGTYIAHAASFSTDDIHIVSIVGDDFPREVLASMNERNINTDGIAIMPGEKTFFWAGEYHDNLNDRTTITTELNVLDDFDPQLNEVQANADVVMLGNLTPEIQLAVLDQMKKKPKLVGMDTMNFWMDVAMDNLMKVISRVDLLMINDEEARQLSGKFNLLEAADAILDMGPQYLVIKKGEHGALLFGNGEMFAIPAMPLERVVDPTGAGDSFAGGLMGHICSNEDDINFETVKQGVVNGTVLASFCVEDFSLDRIKKLTNAEVAKRHEAIRLVTRFA